MAQDAKTRLVDVAAELLWTQGYTATSPRDLQRAASVGQGSMYHHFNGKADLARHAVERVADRMRGELGKLLGTTTGLAAIDAYLRKRREPLGGCRLGRLAQEPGVVDDPDLRAPIGSYFEDLITELAARMSERTETTAAEPDPVALASAAVAVVQGAYVLARATGDADVFSRAVDGFASLLEPPVANGRVK